jgi:prepilin-type N-terminal cleavage/methylation domain-containing protein
LREGFGLGNGAHGVTRPTCLSQRGLELETWRNFSVVVLALWKNEERTMKSWRNSGRAFTVIELLVVIAIIGILAAMLLPVLSRAKNKAARTTDINNLKQMVTAVHLHASENQDVMPWSNWAAGDEPGRAGWLYMMPADVAVDTPRFDVKTGLFWPLLHTPKLYFCPMDGSQVPLFSQRSQQISSYVMNGAVNGYNRVSTNHLLLEKLGNMPPDAVVFWETDETDANFFNDGASNPAEGVSKRHNQGAINGFFHGSVAYTRFTDWYAKAGSTNKNSLWCYPGSDNGH